MSAIKYIFELIVVFYLVRLGLRFLDSLFGTRPNVSTSNNANKQQASNNANWQGYQDKKSTTNSDADYIDYEEIKP